MNGFATSRQARREHARRKRCPDCRGTRRVLASVPGMGQLWFTIRCPRCLPCARCGRRDSPCPPDCGIDVGGEG